MKLFSNASHFVPNKDWTGYVKVGSAADLQLQEATEAPAPATTAGSTIHVAKSLDGPWEPLSPNTLGGCNNPAPWVHPRNGTIFIVSFLTAVVGLVVETGRSDDASLAGLRQLAQALGEHLRPVA